jgi:drug/metabolite transporter (DMT)-like permease
MRGEILIILAQISWAISTFLVKKLTGEINPVLITIIIALSGTIFTLPLLFYFSKDLKAFIGKNLIFAILAGVLWIAVGEILYVLGLSKIPISRASLLTLTFPLFVTLLGVIFLGEKISLRFILASLLIAIGYIILVK